MASGRGGSRRSKGDVGFQKLIKRLPDAARGEMFDILEDAGPVLVGMMKTDAPSRTGALRAGISWKVAAGSLRLSAGILGKSKNRRLFYAIIIEKGRKPKEVSVTRRLQAGGRDAWRRRIRAGNKPIPRKPNDLLAKPYPLKITRLPPRPFVWKSRPEFRAKLGGLLRRFWENTLADAAEGVSFDE